MSRAWPWYKAYPRDFLDDTIGWPADLKGTYRIVLDLIYMHDGYLVDDPAYITAYTGLSSKRKWSVIREELIKRGKLQLIDGLLTNHRAVIETKNRRKVGDKSEINESVPNKNNDLAKIETEADSYKTPNPLKGDDAALGFLEIFEGNLEGIQHTNAETTTQQKEPETTDWSWVSSTPQSEARAVDKLRETGSTRANAPPGRCAARYSGNIAVSKEPDRRTLYVVRLAQCEAMSRNYFFESAAQPRRQNITARPDFRRGLIAGPLWGGVALGGGMGSGMSGGRLRNNGEGLASNMRHSVTCHALSCLSE